MFLTREDKECRNYLKMSAPDPLARPWSNAEGYFQDPDGHQWEVAWNPQWRIPE
jgi:hypothetical protein